MIAIDTNILIRYLVRDSSRQVPVLERAYGFARTEVRDSVLRLTYMDNLITENRADVVNAAFAYGQGSADFADLMILAAAKRVGAAPLYTFDQRLAREEGAALLGAQPA